MEFYGILNGILNGILIGGVAVRSGFAEHLERGCGAKV